MKTNELIGPALDWAVAQCEGYAYKTGSLTRNSPFDDGALEHIWHRNYKPSTDWEQGGPIIERERITIDAGQHGALWIARKGVHECIGPTPLIAAMRCYVASKLGDTVDVPPELQ